MDLWERRLQSLEADYAETIAAGERAEQRRRLEAIVAEHRAEYQLVSDHETEACAEPEVDGVETPSVDVDSGLSQESAAPTPRPIEPLSLEEVQRIKQDMSSIRLKHEPVWARQITDQQLLDLLHRVTQKQ